MVGNIDLQCAGDGGVVSKFPAGAVLGEAGGGIVGSRAVAVAHGAHSLGASLASESKSHFDRKKYRIL